MPHHITLDPGHGGHSPVGNSTPFGQRGPLGTAEKDLALALAQAVAMRLDQEVSFTRFDDRNVSLGERILAARAAGADAFVSLHAGGGRSGRPEVWVHPQASPASLALAQRLAASLGDGVQSAPMLQGELAVLSPEHHGTRAAVLLEAADLHDPEVERWLLNGGLDVLAAQIADGLAGDVGAYGNPFSWLKGKVSAWKAKRKQRKADKVSQRLDAYLESLGGGVGDAAAAARDALVKSGLDFKGQVSVAYATLGGGVKLGVAVDVGKFFAPFMTGEVGVSAAGTNATQAMFIASFAPPALHDASNRVTWQSSTPVNLAMMLGHKRTFTGEVSFAVGVSTPEVPSMDGVLELTAEASAKVTATVAYTGEYVYLGDPAPTRYQRPGWPRSIDTGIKQRVAGAKDQATHPASTAWPRADRLDFLSLLAHGPEASLVGSIGAKAGVSAGNDLVGAKVGVGAEASAGVGGAFKMTSYRYQATAAGAHGALAVTTQDTQVRYWQVRLHAGVEVGGEAEANVGPFGREASLPLLDKSKEKVFNGMDYKSATACWMPPAHGARTVALQEGSGLCFGHAVRVRRLCAAAVALSNPGAARPKALAAARSLVKTLANVLGTTEAQIAELLANSWFSDRDIAAQPDAWFPTPVVLVEARWAAPPHLEVPLDGSKVDRPVLAHDLYDGMLRSRRQEPSRWTLHALSVRFRIVDAGEDNSKSQFTLGLKVGIVKLSVDVSSVDQVGSHGAVDLFTRWYGPFAHVNTTTGNEVAAYNQAVPPVALLMQ